MTMTACKAQEATCVADDAGCGNYFDCVIQCPQNGQFNSCAVGKMGCLGSPDTDPNYANVKSCACMGCMALCPGLCG
jgi:hypothetical protein